jgi:hypothetical protein
LAGAAGGVFACGGALSAGAACAHIMPMQMGRHTTSNTDFWTI